MAALDEWCELAKKYPPALDKLKKVRDEAAEVVTEHKGDVRGAFDDIRLIDEELGEPKRTVDAFLVLDMEAPEAARSVYDIAEPALIKAKKYSLCGKYLEPERTYADMVELYELDRQLGAENEAKEESLDRKHYWHESADRIFVQRAAPLIALLVLNDRKPEAEKIAERVKSQSKYSKRDAVIDAALQGKLPELPLE